MLRALHLTGVGPSPRLDLDFAPRLNVLTGDNGLGKSFVLEVAFWALTDTWIERPALPRADWQGEPAISSTIVLARGQAIKEHGRYNRLNQQWELVDLKNTRSGYVSRPPSLMIPAWLEEWCPVLYARADAGFSVWDPTRNYQPIEGRMRDAVSPEPYHFDQRTIWSGLRHGEKALCNGLIQDWVSWQQESDGEDEHHPFQLLCRVLNALSHPKEPLKPGKPRRLFLDDIRKFPTLDLPYDNVPVIHASAGMQRILALAYLITWTWIEHLESSKLIGREPAKQIVLLVDEVETHLHPQWQRHIVRALLTVLEGLAPSMKAQVFLTTHAPMILASLEPYFDRAQDKLFLFDLVEGSKDIELREISNIKQGDATGWLTSEIFELGEARSIEAEQAIAAAHAMMRGDTDELPPHLTTIEAIDRELHRVLPAQDPILPAWIVFRDKSKP